MRKRVVDVGRLPLVVREWGETDRPVVFWPGLNPFGAHALQQAGPRWADEYGLHVYAISAPGMGESPRLPDEDYRLPRLAAFAGRFLDSLKVGPIAFVGFSWGASLACHVAALEPSRLGAVALLDAAYSDVPGGRPLAEWVDGVRTMSVERGYTSWDADAAGAAFWGVAEHPPTAQLGAVAATGLPVLLLVSSERGDTEEGLAALRAFRNAVPQAEVVRIADSGHDLLADQPEETIAAVGEFLRRVDSTP